MVVCFAPPFIHQSVSKLHLIWATFKLLIKYKLLMIDVWISFRRPSLCQAFCCQVFYHINLTLEDKVLAANPTPPYIDPDPRGSLHLLQENQHCTLHRTPLRRRHHQDLGLSRLLCLPWSEFQHLYKNQPTINCWRMATVDSWSGQENVNNNINMGKQGKRKSISSVYIG